MQAAYEQFGCNEGNVFFMGIDKGNTNEDVMYFDSVYGIQYPGVSGMNGGGNAVHLDYQVQATPSFVVILPNKEIAVKQVWPPSTSNIVDSLVNVGGILQSCITSIPENSTIELVTISPNPVKDIAQITVDLSTEKEIEIQIYNLTGRKVKKFESQYYSQGRSVINADLSAYPEGLYLVRILEKQAVLTTKKLIIAR